MKLWNIFLIFPRKWDLTFCANFHLGDKLHEMSNSVFREKLKKNIQNCCLLKFLSSVLSVKCNRLMAEAVVA